MKAIFIKDIGQWLIKVSIDATEDIPRSGNTVTVKTRDGKQVEKTLGDLVDSSYDIEFIFTKGQKKEEKIDFMNFANVDSRTWYQFKKGVSKHNKETDDKIIIAHASRTLDGLVGRLVTESGERIIFPLAEQK